MHFATTAAYFFKRFDPKCFFMEHICLLHPINLSDNTVLESRVEHRRVFNLKHCELNIFETCHQCRDVSLSHNGLVISSMMRGKKRMSLSSETTFDFLPGETIILPEGVSMKVDFPEADEKHPVQCITLVLEWDMVYRTLDFLNETYPNKESPFEWKLNFSQYHFRNNRELAQSLNKLTSISMEDNIAKDALADLSLKILLLRIIQTQNLAVPARIQDHRFAPVIHYIKKNLSEKLNIKALAREACMSQSAFFHSFRENFGLSPLEYILNERINLAKNILVDSAISISEACYQSGFNNLNHFIKLFKRIEGITPKEYRNR